MKTRIFALLFVAAVFTTGKVAQAQYNESMAGINVGASMINMLFKTFDYADEVGFSTKSIPAIQLSYDRFLNDRFSVGAAMAYSRVSLNYQDPNVPQPVADGEVSHFEASLTRVNVAARALFYYTNKDFVNIYTGLRFGINNYGLKASSNDPDFVEDDVFTGGLFSRSMAPGAQLILFGANIFPADNFGINLEFAIGQPYFASVGLKYRF
jgi:hypothetical protein